MTLDLLDAPLRVSWTLAEGGVVAPSASARAIAADLVAAGAFFVLLDGAPLRHPALRELVTHLGAGGIQVELVTDGSPAELAALAPGWPLAALLLDAAPFVAAGQGLRLGLAPALEGVRGAGYPVALWLEPRRQHLAQLPELLCFCRDHGVSRLKLPNLRLAAPGGVRPGEIPAAADWAAQAGRLRAAAGLAGDLTLEIHDRFLWELLAPVTQTRRLEYEGCQAGNSLAHIDPAGQVHPCSSWPEPLGRLSDSSLEEIWASPARRTFRQRLSQTPPGCRGCRELALCFGGCRGLGALVNVAGGERDPGCSGPR